MSEIAKVNRDQAKISPETEFSHPRDVVENAIMTRAEKLTTLQGWAFEVQRRLDAADEGMAPESTFERKDGDVTSDSELLRAIELEISSLASESSGPDAA